MEEEKFFKERTDNNIFKQIIYKYLPFWPLFLFTIGVSMVVSYIDLRSQIPMYVASARALLKDPKQDGGESKVLEALNIFSEKKIVDNEIVVLRSSDMMQQVVKELDLYARVFNEGNVQTKEIYRGNSPVRFVALDKDNFHVYGKHYFTMDWDKGDIIIRQQTGPFYGHFENRWLSHGDRVE